MLCMKSLIWIFTGLSGEGKYLFFSLLLERHCASFWRFLFKSEIARKSMGLLVGSFLYMFFTLECIYLCVVSIWPCNAILLPKFHKMTRMVETVKPRIFFSSGQNFIYNLPLCPNKWISIFLCIKCLMCN